MRLGEFLALTFRNSEISIRVNKSAEEWRGTIKFIPESMLEKYVYRVDAIRDGSLEDIPILEVTVW